MQHRFEAASEHGAATDAMTRSVAAALNAIRGVRDERAAPTVRAARLTLAAVHGATRLQRRRERVEA